MSEQDLERIADIMTRLTNSDDRALIARLAMRDLVATLVQRDGGRMVLAALDEAGELGMTMEAISRRVSHILGGPALAAVIKEFVDRGEITADRDPRDRPCGGTIPIRLHMARQALQKPTAG